MALIIQLNREAEQIHCTAGDTRACEDVSADIILFPGVRYERWFDQSVETGDQQDQESDDCDCQIQRDWIEV